MPRDPVKGILFLCVANSARSQMAEGLARSVAPPSLSVWSAGSRPTRVRPEAIAVLREIGIDISHHRSKSVEDVPVAEIGTVVTLCGEEECPVFLGKAARLRWELPDPAAAAGDEEQRLAAFRGTRDELRGRIAALIGELGRKTVGSGNDETHVNEGGAPMKISNEKDDIVAKVRDRYARIAELGDCGCCGGTTAEGSTPDDIARRIGYDEGALAQVPEGANLGLGCGAPVGFLALAEGETVVDLGSGAGFDAFLAAREVGPNGKVIGVDMTPEMLERARANAVKAGLGWVEFREGRLEALPVEAASVDAVTSNCVINLAPDKAQVFREAARVLRRGGRMVVSDIILDGELPEVVKRDVEAYAGCIAGAMRREPYFEAIQAAGFEPAELLEDVDYVAALGEDALPDDLLRKMEGNGLGLADLRGKVRSVTYRAVRA